MLLRNELEVQSIEFIGGVQYRTGHEQFWSVRAGVGASAILGAKREVDYFTRFISQQPDETSELLAQDHYDLKTGSGSRIMPVIDLAIGHRSGVHRAFDLELFVRNDLDDWVYTVTNVQQVTQQVDLRRRVIGVRCGIRLGDGRARPEPRAGIRERMADRS